MPVLDYCTPIWNPYLQKNIAAVEKIQRTATRMILKQRRQDEPYESRLARLNLFPLSKRREYQSLCLISKLLINGQSDSVPILSLITINSRHTDKRCFNHLSFKKTSTKNSCIFSFPTKWSALPNDVKNSLLTANFNIFKGKLKVAVYSR